MIRKQISKPFYTFSGSDKLYNASFNCYALKVGIIAELR